jgi:type IV pilus assembly protein PilW
VIGQQLQMAGFVPADAPLPQLRPTLFGCSSARPTGADDNLTYEALASRSDGIAIRYIGDNVSTWPSSTGQSTDCLGQAVNAGEAAPGAGRVLIVNRFYAKQSGSTSEFELYCDGNGKSGSAQPLVEGVERLRVKYWLAGAQSALDAICDRNSPVGERRCGRPLRAGARRTAGPTRTLRRLRRCQRHRNGHARAAGVLAACGASEQ